MKKIGLLFIFCFSMISTAQEIEVKQSIITFFEGFHAKDTLKIKTVCHPKMVLQSIAETKKGTKYSEETAQVFLQSFAKFPKELQFEERLLDYKIQIDGTMAHVWTPYEFYVNGSFSHSGVNSFTLFYENNQWKIVHLIDTRRKK
ncbi:nuclear transport factor 2 family protein [Flavobacterium sp.]|uniref:nuclear transport factor 2 family protein n=1 Tax=Flavobacterium sp. TaxID=239 RepID=UPI0035B04F25